MSWWYDDGGSVSLSIPNSIFTLAFCCFPSTLLPHLSCWWTAQSHVYVNATAEQRQRDEAAAAEFASVATVIANASADASSAASSAAIDSADASGNASDSATASSASAAPE
jgi:hypothetical protein